MFVDCLTITQLFFKSRDGFPKMNIFLSHKIKLNLQIFNHLSSLLKKAQLYFFKWLIILTEFKSLVDFTLRIFHALNFLFKIPALLGQDINNFLISWTFLTFLKDKFFLLIPSHDLLKNIQQIRVKVLNVQQYISFQLLILVL